MYMEREINIIPERLMELGADRVYSTDADYVVLDFEIDTSHGDYGHPVHKDNGMLLACWLRPAVSGEMRSAWGDEFSMQELVSDIEAADFVVAHNAKYEFGWLRRMGVDVTRLVTFDTKIAEAVLLGNLHCADERGWRGLSTSLDACLKRRGVRGKDPAVDIMMHDGINPVEMPRPWLEQRCRTDVWYTQWLFQRQHERLSATDRLPVLMTRCMLTPILAEMEFAGMRLDSDDVKQEIELHRDRLAELEHELQELVGDINWRSPIQKAEAIYDKLGFKEIMKRDGTPKRTAAGGRMTDVKALDALEATTDEQRRFKQVLKETSKVGSAISKNLEFFDGICREHGEVFHAVFNQTNTATHRLSSSGIRTFIEHYQAEKTAQFQNLPNAFKYLFKAKRDGWLMAECDGSTLEWRAGGILSGDPQLIDDVEQGRDVHRISAMEQFKVAYEDVSDEQRKKAKAVTFRPMYGGRQGLEEYAKAWAERYKVMVAMQEGWCDEVANNKVLMTPWGMRYYFPHARRNQYGYLNVRTSVFNYPIQAFATAEVIPIALCFLWHRIVAEGLQDRIVIVNTVHDSVIAEIHPDAVDDFRRLAIQSFTHDVYSYVAKVYGLQFDLPLGTGITVGPRWSVGEEEKYNVYPNGKEVRVA
jgi:DNA polymerase-1